jgi:hypothetical protein
MVENYNVANSSSEGQQYWVLRNLPSGLCTGIMSLIERQMYQCDSVSIILFYFVKKHS